MLQNIFNSITKPIRKGEFASLKEWWNNRIENEQAWKADIDGIRENGFNLDIKNSFVKEEKISYNSSELVDMLSLSFKKSNELIEDLKRDLE